MFAVVIVAVMGCSTADPEPTPYDREDFTPYAGPPVFPIIFAGTFTVDGEPGPADQTIYAEFIHGGSPRSTTFEGEYVQVILGPVSTDDLEHGIIHFYLGTRAGDHVLAEETWEWGTVSQPTNQVLNLTFPRLPKN
jgi:hypothetical protein